MEYSINQLTTDIAKEAHFLDKMISSKVSEEFTNDFAIIIAKIKQNKKLSSEEEVKLSHLYYRYHSSLEFVNTKTILEKLYV